MTEADWLACNDPRPMVLHLGGAFSRRRRFGFALACARRHCRVAADHPHRTTIETLARRALAAAEAVEDGLADAGQPEPGRPGRALKELLAPALSVPGGFVWDVHAAVHANAVYWAKKVQYRPPTARPGGAGSFDEVARVRQESRFQAALLRELVG